MTKDNQTLLDENKEKINKIADVSNKTVINLNEFQLMILKNKRCNNE